jgi:hypothetical protein
MKTVSWREKTVLIAVTIVVSFSLLQCNSKTEEKQAKTPVADQNLVATITASSTMDSNPVAGPQGILTGKTTWHAQKPSKYPEWVEIKYAIPQKFTKIAIKPQDKSPQGTEYIRGPKDFSLQASNDGKEWVNLIEVKNDLYKNPMDWHEWSFENKKAYSIYRLFITAGGSPELLTVQQIKFE